MMQKKGVMVNNVADISSPEDEPVASPVNFSNAVFKYTGNASNGKTLDNSCWNIDSGVSSHICYNNHYLKTCYYKICCCSA